MNRYDIGLWCADGEMIQKENGEYVLHSDVIALEQENERLKAELSKAKADQERFVWLVTHENTYRYGNKNPPHFGYSPINEWRTYIDEQRAKG